MHDANVPSARLRLLPAAATNMSWFADLEDFGHLARNEMQEPVGAAGSCLRLS